MGWVTSDGMRELCTALSGLKQRGTFDETDRERPDVSKCGGPRPVDRRRDHLWASWPCPNAPEDTVDITNAILTNRSMDCADYATTNTARVTDVQEQKAFTCAVEIIAQDDACTLQSNKIPFFFLRIRRGFFWTYALDATVTRFLSSIPASQF